MATTSTKSPSAIAYWPDDHERRPVGSWEWKRAPWKPGQQVRVVSGPVVTTGAPTALVWLEDRDNPGLVFRLEVDANGQMVGFSVRPLVYVAEYRPDGTLFMVGMEIDETALVPGAPRLSAALLQRKVKVGRLHAAAVAAIKGLARLLPVDESLPVFGDHEGTDGVPRARRDGIPDEELARYAKDYSDFVAAGHARDVNVRLAAKWKLSLEGVSYRNRRARARDLLSRTGKGRPGGGLTDRATAILEGR